MINSTPTPKSRPVTRAMIIRTMLLAGLLISLAGCQIFSRAPRFGWRKAELVTPVASEPAFSVFASPRFTNNRPKRVLILESGMTKGRYSAAEKLIAELSAQIRSQGVFQVIAPTDVRLRSYPDDIVRGRFDEREIAELSRRYNADAVALVRVNEIRAYAPLRTSVTMAIIDSHDSIVTFAVDGNWDTANLGLQSEFQTYVANHSPPTPNSGVTPSIHLESPNYLFAFVASQITGALR